MGAMQIELRRAGADDRGLLLTLSRGLYECEHLPFDEARAARGVDGLLADSSLGGVWVIERVIERAGAAGERGDSIGYAVLTLGYSLEFGGRFALLDELFIREEHRGAGAGRQVLVRIEEICRGLGLQAVRLEVERTNRAARELYRKVGFEAHDRDLMTLWIA
jgi:GNAT superfamily N-acetyltransferase